MRSAIDARSATSHTAAVDRNRL